MQEITLKLNVDKTNAILTALAELPFKMSAELIAEIRQQAQEQLQPPTVVEPVTE